MIHNICVFCGSRPGRDPAFAEAAGELGALLAREGLGLVYGGAKVGLMGIVADAVLAGGGRAVGVIPGFMRGREIAHTGLTELYEVESMHERKAKMAELSDAFIALPGGMGTLEELCEVATWAQIGLHAKPCGLLNAAGYFDPLLAFLARMAEQGFVAPKHIGLIKSHSRPSELLDALRDARPGKTGLGLART